jgi:hypothetical protein
MEMDNIAAAAATPNRPPHQKRWRVGDGDSNSGETQKLNILCYLV